MRFPRGLEVRRGGGWGGGEGEEIEGNPSTLALGRRFLTATRSPLEK